MSALDAVSAATKGNTLSPNAGVVAPLSVIPSNGSYHNGGLQSPTTVIDGFHKNSHDLAMVFSQVPWMRFSIVAQPDLVQLAGNETLKGFVHDVTSVTIATVSQQIHAEITKAVDQVIKNIVSSVKERMTTVHEGIMKEIVCVNAEKTATESEKLGIPPFDLLLKDILAGSLNNGGHVCVEPVPAPSKLSLKTNDPVKV